MKKYFTTLYILLEIILLTLCGILIFNGCRIEDKSSSFDNFPDTGRELSFATWNVQTFFDAVKSGTEYGEFLSSKNWDENKYKVRLDRLCEVISYINADIIVIEEIENENVMQDISNMMAGNSWNRKKVYEYGCFMKNKGDAIGCGVFSKFPVTEIKNHNIDIKCGALKNCEKQPRMRPISQVSIDVNGRTLSVFVNHWKSKSGGAEKTEIWRKWQEAVLYNSVKKVLGEKCSYGAGTCMENDSIGGDCVGGNCVGSDAIGGGCIAAGDFNRDIKEFTCIDGNIILQDKFINFETGEAGAKKIIGYTPWLNENCDFATECGSYYYDDNWERIDNIFSFGNVKISNFEVITDGCWTDEMGKPIKYSCFNGKGYSDHLPLKCTVTF